MENKIKVLPEIVANQIAAGEVVDNPSSVVKEMMENAIDAGASSVTVNFRNAGMELIQIIDNGCGMSPIDARMAFDRHATSKIASLDDVYRLHTFGFRGEALASIAAVAQVELRSRRAEDETGTVTIVNGGEFVSQTPTMCPEGSQFLVRNLFYTAPARRKFNSDRTRIVSDIKREFRRVALCNPQVRCELMSNDMAIITLPAGSLQERIIDVVGRYIKSNLLEVSVDTTIVKIKGYVGRPSAAKQKNVEQYLFVNGRYFRSAQIYRSILKSYEKLIPENCTPSFFLYLTVDPDRVDVNVSPHKTEVRFADADEVNQIVSAAVRSTLAKSGAVSMMDFDNKMAIDIPAINQQSAVVYPEPKSSSNDDYNPFREDYATAADPSADVDFTGFDAPYDGKVDADAVRHDASLGSISESFGGVRGKSFSHADMFDAGAAKTPETDNLRSMAWAEMTLNSDFAVDDTTVAAPHSSASAEGGYRDIPSSSRVENVCEDVNVETGSFSDMSPVSVMPAAAETGQGSRLEFIASACVQQTIEHEQKPSFSDVLSLGNGYAVAVCCGRTMIVDLHRAEQRILYDDYMSMMQHNSSATQKLLFPETLVLSTDDYALLEENIVEFAALGFDMNMLGEGSVELSGLPSGVTSEQADRLIYDLLREIEACGSAGERMRRDMVRVVALKQARNLSKAISSEQAAEILRQLVECDDFSFSPSGKAIMAELSADELKNKLN